MHAAHLPISCKPSIVTHLAVQNHFVLRPQLLTPV
jgi:hypothetical protein